MAGSRAGARGAFPGKPAKLFLDRRQARRVSAKRFSFNRDSLELAENVSRGVICFNSMIGDSKEEEFHGFSDAEIQLARSRLDLLASEADIARQKIWASRGVTLDRGEREVIKQNTSAQKYYTIVPRTSYHKKKDKSILQRHTNTVNRANKTSVKRDSSGKSVASTINDESTPVISNVVKKIKTDIQIPSWRNVEYPFELTVTSEDYYEECEDTSDEAFIIRHSRAEEEEQELWEKWQDMREAQGVQAGGRSKSSRWREGIDLASDEELRAPRLRSQRVSSLLSDTSSTPGRLSPATMERVKEICVVENSPSPPTYSTPSSSVPSTPKKNSGTPVPRSPRTRAWRKFDSQTMEKDNNSISSEEVCNLTEDTEVVIETKCNNIKVDNILPDKKKELNKDVTDAVNNIVRRTKSDTSGMRRTSSKDQLAASNVKMKISKENFASQLMDSINRISDSSNQFSTSGQLVVGSISRVLKDSNVEKSSRLVHHLGRQASKKTILSQKPIFFRNDYPLRSQSLSRRTRQGAKR